MPTFLALVGMFISVLLIGIILLQRGRGGGLVGALSGLGGQSAFGTKAGDMFTRITIGIAAAWVLLAGIHGQVLRSGTKKFTNKPAEISSPLKDKKDKDEGSSSSKSDDSKDDSDFSSLLTDPTEDGGKKGATKTKPKSDEPLTEDSKDDPKKDAKDDKPTATKTEPKEETKPEPKAKDDAKPTDESKKDGESK